MAVEAQTISAMQAAQVAAVVLRKAPFPLLPEKASLSTLEAAGQEACTLLVHMHMVAEVADTAR